MKTFRAINDFQHSSAVLACTTSNCMKSTITPWLLNHTSGTLLWSLTASATSTPVLHSIIAKHFIAMVLLHMGDEETDPAKLGKWSECTGSPLTFGWHWLQTFQKCAQQHLQRSVIFLETIFQNPFIELYWTLLKNLVFISHVALIIGESDIGERKEQHYCIPSATPQDSDTCLSLNGRM